MFAKTLYPEQTAVLTFFSPYVNDMNDSQSKGTSSWWECNQGNELSVSPTRIQFSLLNKSCECDTL
jgi:hypothetical protein